MVLKGVRILKLKSYLHSVHHNYFLWFHDPAPSIWLGRIRYEATNFSTYRQCLRTSQDNPKHRRQFLSMAVKNSPNQIYFWMPERRTQSKL